MSANLPVATKDAYISLYDERLNLFVNTADIVGHLEVLGAIAIEFTMHYPMASYVINWPPVEIILDRSSELSPLKALYSALFENLSESGYPVTVLATLSVLHHAPRENTIIKTSTHLRLGRLH